MLGYTQRASDSGRKILIASIALCHIFRNTLTNHHPMLVLQCEMLQQWYLWKIQLGVLVAGMTHGGEMVIMIGTDLFLEDLVSPSSLSVFNICLHSVIFVLMTCRPVLILIVEWLKPPHYGKFCWLPQSNCFELCLNPLPFVLSGCQIYPVLILPVSLLFCSHKFVKHHPIIELSLKYCQKVLLKDLQKYAITLIMSFLCLSRR